MKRIAGYLERVDALTPRERVILFVLLLAAVWALVDAFLLGPLDKSIAAEQERLQAAASRISAAQDTLTLQEGQRDPTAAVRQRLAAAQQAMTRRMQETADMQQRLVSAKDMTQALQGLLRRQPGLRLAALTTLPPEPIGGGSEGTHAEAVLYRQGVRITLIGGYASLVRYMESLEKLPAGFYWSRAELDASRHPEIALTLTLYTLSMEATWLTV